MTDERIDAMQAGPEMDRAVLDAIGEPRHSGCDESGAFRLVRRRLPSTDWNDAMYAAERINLFGIHTVLGVGDFGDWTVLSWEGTTMTEISSADTGPLAICRAILKLAKVESQP